MIKQEKALLPEDCTVTIDGQLMIEKARRDGVETVWDRYQEQKNHCTFCEAGLTCGSGHYELSQPSAGQGLYPGHPGKTDDRFLRGKPP